MGHAPSIVAPLEAELLASTSSTPPSRTTVTRICTRAVLLLAVPALLAMSCGRSNLRGIGDCISGFNNDGTCQPPGSDEICLNGVDDDGNGLADCDDPACAVFPFCDNGGEICDNGK